MILWPWPIWRRSTIWKNRLEPDLEIAAFCPPKPKITQLETFFIEKKTHLTLTPPTPPNYQPRPEKKLQLHPLPKKNMQMQIDRDIASKELGGLPYLFQGNTGNGRHQKTTLQPFRRTHLGWPDGWKMRRFSWEGSSAWIWGMIAKSYASTEFFTLERQYIYIYYIPHQQNIIKIRLPK